MNIGLWLDIFMDRRHDVYPAVALDKNRSPAFRGTQKEIEIYIYIYIYICCEVIRWAKFGGVSKVINWAKVIFAL